MPCAIRSQRKNQETKRLDNGIGPNDSSSRSNQDCDTHTNWAKAAPKTSDKLQSSSQPWRVGDGSTTVVGGSELVKSQGSMGGKAIPSTIATLPGSLPEPVPSLRLCVLGVFRGTVELSFKGPGSASHLFSILFWRTPTQDACSWGFLTLANFFLSSFFLSPLSPLQGARCEVRGARCLPAARVRLPSLLGALAWSWTWEGAKANEGKGNARPQETRKVQLVSLENGQWPCGAFAPAYLPRWSRPSVSSTVLPSLPNHPRIQGPPKVADGKVPRCSASSSVFLAVFGDRHGPHPGQGSRSEVPDAQVIRALRTAHHPRTSYRLRVPALP
ncbi:hypothetical protein BDP55DRAFT_635500 [Colletotrichum godetiae]|uniref:Uncharacterized protein n=1 Tax=Colletotrichum godetiae TaxID=1209918 RepID=A0AAJ0EPN1_9PEZI|nr:uncharacterized protein BDP55DRAFT_635500 [Colletotrichum godetiae]KAK1671871.1 hypothetical protein BDP55DRAFT_635500 [Colletotrichum godetiae]